MREMVGLVRGDGAALDAVGDLVGVECAVPELLGEPRNELAGADGKPEDWQLSADSKAPKDKNRFNFQALLTVGVISLSHSGRPYSWARVTLIGWRQAERQGALRSMTPPVPITLRV